MGNPYAYPASYIAPHPAPLDIPRIMRDVVNSSVKQLIDARMDEMDKKWGKIVEELAARIHPVAVEPAPPPNKKGRKARAPHNEVSHARIKI